MKHKLHLTIPTPCHKRWDDMTATDRGAFCHSCRKEVVDFATMTDAEVIRWLERHDTGCGRFRADQLDRDMSLPVVHDSPLRWKVLLMSLLPAFSLAPLAARAALPPLTDQAPRISKADTATAKADTTTATCDATLTGVCGRVLDEYNEGLIGAIVQVIDAKGASTGQEITADLDGNFTLPLDHGSMVRLKVTSAGYKTQLLTAAPSTHPYLIIHMLPDTSQHSQIVMMGRPITGLIERDDQRSSPPTVDMTTHEHKPDTAIAPIDTPVTACDTMLTGICGRILDETGEGLIGATVQVIDTNGKTTGQGAVADIDGNFTLALRDTGTVTLRATYVGYETQVLTARPTTHPYMTIRMKEDTVNFGNMVGIMVIHRTPAQKVKAWFRHSFYTLTHLREYREYKLARQRMKD